MDLDIFTSREIAAIIWIFIIFVVLLFNIQIRTSIFNLVKIALNKHLMFYFLTYLCYLSSITCLLYYLELWDLSNFKDTVIWFMFSGLPIGLTVATNKIGSDFWKKLVLDNLKLAVLVTFIISSFTFPLVIEFVLLPIASFIVMLNTFAKSSEEYKPVEKITASILAVFGAFLLLYSLYRTLSEIYSIGNISTFKSFMIPVVFSAISIPYMYAFKLYVEYEILFLKLKFGTKKSRKLNLLIKLRLLMFCNIQLKKLQIATSMNNYNIMSISSITDVDDMITNYKKAPTYEKKYNGK